MTLFYPKGILGSLASLLVATLYQGNPDRIYLGGGRGFNHLLDYYKYILRFKPCVLSSHRAKASTL
jgi:hypothetical protein